MAPSDTPPSDSPTNPPAPNDPTGSRPRSDESHRPAVPSAEELAALPRDGGDRWNRLVFEKSPYLQQHAANPVDWYPWGDEAFETARAEDKPIFLSVGYSTCHWCHVMEHESFEDEEVAELLNESFVCVKVDREERPDVDHVYMTVTQALTGSGGWPMTVALTPDKKPFFAGTYYPKHGGFGRPGMMQLVPRLATAWKTEREAIDQSAEQVSTALAGMVSGHPGDALGEETLATAFAQLRDRYDATHGGFGTAPKFPTPHQLSFLLRYWRRTQDAQALDMVDTTMRRMRQGGVYDHLGHGIHRYSTDREWLLPHFEKMLYDQALLAIAALETYQATGDEEHARTAREVFGYVLRDLTSAEGGFYSAEDADSEGVEGKFYVWTPEELHEILGDDAALVIDAWNVENGGNFHDQATGQRTGESILHLREPLSDIAGRHGVDEATLRERLETCRERLFEVRERRIRPGLDDKILTDWNGLMIAAFARGAQVLGDRTYLDAATRAADFTWERLRAPNGRLLKRYRDGEAALPAVADDHAFFGWGLLELYEASFEVRYLERALAVTEDLLAHFWDEEHGGLFMTADDGERLPVRGKEIYDGALPSGNSVAAGNLLRLSRLTGDERHARRAEEIVKAFSGAVARGPASFTQLLIAVDFAVGPSHEVVVAGDPDADDTQRLLAALRRPFVPNKVMLLRPDGERPDIVRLAPFAEHQVARDGRTTVYVCRDFACHAPTSDAAEALERMEVDSNGVG